MRIDVHAHYWTDGYLDLLVDLGKADAGAARGIGKMSTRSSTMPSRD
jgi:6-methylsalicylate decarboxylase